MHKGPRSWRREVLGPLFGLLSGSGSWCPAAESVVWQWNLFTGSGINCVASEPFVWHHNQRSGNCNHLFGSDVIYAVRQQNQLFGSGICYLTAEPAAWQQKHLNTVKLLYRIFPKMEPFFRDYVTYGLIIFGVCLAIVLICYCISAKNRVSQEI